MKTIIGWSVAIVLSLSGAAMAQAPTSSPKGSATPATPAGPMEMASGVVTAVTPTACTIQLDGGGAKKTFDRGHNIAANWKVGDHVVIQFDPKTSVLESIVKD